MPQPQPMTGTSADGIRAFDPQTGTTVTVDPAAAQEGFASGRLQLVKGLEYSMRDGDGNVWEIPAEQASAALGKGLTFASRMERVQQEAAAPGAAARAFVDGAVNSATFGLGDGLQTKLGADADAIAARAAAHPVARGFGTASGLAASMLLTGGAGLGGRAAGEAAGAALSEAGANALVSRLGGQIAGGALEGGVIGVNNALSEAALGHSDDVADSLLADAGMGALLGGAVGGGLQVLGDAARWAGGKAVGRVRDVAELVERFSGEAPEAGAASAMKRLLQNTVKRGGEAAGAVLGGAVGGAPGAYLGGRAGGSLAQEALERAGVQRIMSALETRVADGARAVARGGAEAAADVGRLAPRTAAMLRGSQAERDAAFAARADEIRAMAASPESTVNHIAAHTARLQGAVPEATAALHSRVADALSFLHGNLPQGSNADAFSQATLIPAQERARFARIDAALQDPLRVLRADATREEVNAVATVMPRLHARMQKAVMEAVEPAKLDWKRRQRLQFVWGVNTHNAYAPANVRVYQQTYVPAAKGPGRPPKLPPPATPAPAMTETDRITYGM